MSEWRVQFDADVTFGNGGGLSAHEFRLDIPGVDIGDAELGELFVRHLGLLMVDAVTISNKSVIEEAHKGSRGVKVGRKPSGVVELSHVVKDGMVANTGTYVDSPGHRFPGGAELSQTPLT